MTASTSPSPSVSARVREGLRHPRNWLQLLRFAAVGASGYVVNLATFSALVHVFGMDYRVAAAGAFLVAVTNNFLLNRRWTFQARHGARREQATRFFAVSIVAFLCSLAALWTLVEQLGLPEVAAQALAIVAVTPLSFLGNKLWSFTR